MEPITPNRVAGPLITTFIPTYRRPRLLKRAIQSVLDQTFTDFQLIVYDNASGDETRSVVSDIARSDSRVKYFCHSENIGEFKNFQYALQQIDTPFFSILSDDDYILPDFYKTALDGFTRHPESMFSVTDVIHLIRKDRIFNTSLENWSPGFYTAPQGLVNTLECGTFDWMGILFRKEVLDRVGYLDVETRRFHDLDFLFRLAAHHPFTVSKQPGAVFDWSDSEIRAPRQFEETWPGVMKMIQNLTRDNTIPTDVRAYAECRLRRKYLKSLFIREGLVYLYRDKPDEARKVAAVLYDPLDQKAACLVLKTAIVIYQYLPFTRKPLKFLVKYRKILQTKLKNRNGRYKPLMQYIK